MDLQTHQSPVTNPSEKVRAAAAVSALGLALVGLTS